MYPSEDTNLKEEDNYPFDSPTWSVEISFPISQISKKEMIAQQVEAIAATRGGTIGMSSEPSPGFEGGEFGYEVVFEEGDVNTYGFITRIQKEMADFHPTINFDEENITYPSTEENFKKGRKRYAFNLDEASNIEINDGNVVDDEELAATSDTPEERQRTRDIVRRSIEGPSYNTRFEGLEEDDDFGNESITTMINDNNNKTMVKVFYTIVDGEPEPINIIDAETGKPFVNNIEELDAEDFDMIIDALYDNIDVEEAFDGIGPDVNIEPTINPEENDFENDLPEVDVVAEKSLQTFVTGPNGENIPVQVQYTEIQDSMVEGYYTMPSINRERYTEIPGLEGPFQTRAGKVIYYDPKEGQYYDRDTDMYIPHDEAISMLGEDTIDDIKLTKDDEPEAQLTQFAAKLPKSFTAMNGRTYVIMSIINLFTGDDIISQVNDVELNRIQSAVNDLESADFGEDIPVEDIPVNDIEPVAYDYMNNIGGDFSFESILEHITKIFPKNSIYGVKGLKTQLKEAIISLKSKCKIIEDNNSVRLISSHPDVVDTMEYPYEVYYGNRLVADIYASEEGDLEIHFLKRYGSKIIKINDLKDVDVAVQAWAKENGIMEDEVIFKKKLSEKSDWPDIRREDAENIVRDYLKYEDGTKSGDDMINDIITMIEDRGLYINFEDAEEMVYDAFPQSFPMDYIPEDNGVEAIADLVTQVSQDPNIKRQLDQQLRNKENDLKKLQKQKQQNQQNQNQSGQNQQNGMEDDDVGTQDQSGQNQQKSNQGFTKPSGFSGSNILDKTVQNISKSLKTGNLKDLKTGGLNLK
jgi:hypothetical protein